MDAITKKAHQCLHFLKRLRRFSMSPTTLLNFCRCIVESIQTGSIAAWFSNSDAQEQKRLQKMVQSIMGIGHPTVKGILNIIKDTHHPAQVLFALLLSRRRYGKPENHCLQIHDSFFPSSFRFLNHPTLAQATMDLALPWLLFIL